MDVLLPGLSQDPILLVFPAPSGLGGGTTNHTASVTFHGDELFLPNCEIAAQSIAQTR
jgi:hypothetical protein